MKYACIKCGRHDETLYSDEHRNWHCLPHLPLEQWPIELRDRHPHLFEGSTGVAQVIDLTKKIWLDKGADPL